MKNCILILIVSVLLIGCADNSQLKQTVELQQQLIDELDADIKKLQGKQQALESEISVLKKEINTLRDSVNKVSPDYLESSVQEGRN